MSEKRRQGSLAGPSMGASTSISVREVLEAAPDMIFCADSEGRLIWLNAAVEPLLGRNPSDLLGRLFLHLIPDRERAHVARFFARQHRARTEVTVRECHLLAADGNPVPVSVRTRRVERPDGEVVYVGTARTVEVIAEGELLPLSMLTETKLSEVVAQTGGEGTPRPDIVSTMGRELRQPMNGLLNMTKLLLGTELGDDQRQWIEVIQNSARSLLGLVTDTIDFSKIQSEKLDLETLDFDLRVTAEEVAALLLPQAAEKGLDFACMVHHEVPSLLRGDPGRLRQVLLNLGRTMVRTMRQGGGRVRIERAEEDDVRVALKFTVAHAGTEGPDPHFMPAFQHFLEGEAASGGKIEGASLTLSVARRLVELMGGEVGTDLGPGGGQSFWFRIPFEKQAPAAERPTAGGVQLRGLKVLVADPSRASRDQSVGMLAAWGCKPESASQHDEALDRMRAAAQAGHPFQVAMLELAVPDLDGEQLGREIRSDPALRDTLIMLLTNVGSRGDAARMREAGFSAYLVKPLGWPELYDALVDVVRNARDKGAQAPLVTRHSVAESRRGRLRILLAEDNRVNQIVAETALKRLGYWVETVTNGAAVLEAVERERFDLILMDVHMPEVDGCQATAALRAKEGPYAHTPVVAMTADDDPEERGRCMAAGMDDYLTKPIDLAYLCAAVERWTLQRTLSGAHAAPHAPNAAPHAPHPESAPGARSKPAAGAKPGVKAKGEPPPPAAAPEPGDNGSSMESLEASALALAGALAESAPPIDTARLEEACMGMAPLRESLLHTFMAEVRPGIDHLRQHCAVGDARRVEFEAHKLRGMSATIGAAQLAGLLAEIETAAQAEQLDGLESIVGRAKSEVTRVEQQITLLSESFGEAA